MPVGHDAITVFWITVAMFTAFGVLAVLKRTMF